MRELTYQEQTALANGRTILFTEIDGTELDNLTLLLINIAFRDGFTAGLDHAAEEVERLRAENDRLRAALLRWIEYSGALFDTADYERRNIEQSRVLLQLIEDARQALKGER